MNGLIRLNPVRWPYSLEQLRIDEPRRSFPRSPSPERYAHYDVYQFEEVVKLVDPPSTDPATQRLVQRKPVKVDGILTQQWEVIEMSPEEREAYYLSNNPPRWVDFSEALPVGVDQLLGAAQAVRPSLAFRLAVGLGQAAQGDTRVFLSAWQSCLSIPDLVPPELKTELQELAADFDLPPEFIAGLSGSQQSWEWPEGQPSRFTKWTAPDGSQWIFDQPRNAEGTYVSDDSDTEEVESAMRWLPA